MRIFNFCSGPATMPLSVLEKAQAELLNWHDLGASVMEISHRSAEFNAVIVSCESRLRKLLSIPDHYKVLFLQGGGYAQFDAVPMNLLGNKASFDAILTGNWSETAAKVGEKYARANVIFSDKENQYRHLPVTDSLKVNEESAYIHLCANETIYGVEFTDEINTSIPVVADMSSNILSKPVAVEKYGLIYAGAQKNLGPAGVTIVIVREDLLGKAHAHTPEVLNYKIQAEQGSMLNTPPTFGIYMIDLILDWLEVQGGVSAMSALNRKKSEQLYRTIDQSRLYHNPVDLQARSRMNIPFILKDKALEEQFLKEAKKSGLINLAGHRSVGGMRASIYNAMSFEGVELLCTFMTDFEKKYY